MGFLRKLRGIAATALTWAIVWVPTSLIPFTIGSLIGTPLPLRLFVWFVISQAVTGALSGTVFATLLTIFGRRKTFESISLPWIAAWGAVGAMLLPAVGRVFFLATTDVSFPMSAMISTVVMNGVLGAGCAALTLSIARRAPALPSSTEPKPAAVGSGTA